MKKRSSDEEHLVDHANMAKDILGLAEEPIPVEELALKVLKLPGINTKPKSKHPSKKLQQVVHKIGSTFMTLEDSINEALELGRKEGFTDIEIGDMIRAEFKRINRPRMTLARYLPVTAKHMEKARPKSDFGNRMLPNRLAVANKTLPNTGTTTVQHESPGKFNQAPDEYGIEHLQEYDTDYLREIVKSQHDKLAAIAKAEANKDFIQRQDFLNRTEQDREKDREIMKKISLDDLRSWKVKDYDENFRRYALMKIIEEYSKSKRDAEDYRKSSVTFRQDVDVILRHFKLCQLCFFGVGPRDWKKNKPKFVKGVYDRGITTEYDLGWICIKCKADQDRVNRQVGPILGKIFAGYAKMEAEEKEKAVAV